MVGLASLPRDVLVEIFSYFCLHCRGDLKPVKGVGTPHEQKRWREPQQPDQKSWYSIDKYTLFSLAASCKALHAVAEDVLYHDFAPGYGDSELSELYTFGNRLNQFMGTVGSRKDLADKVRFLFVHPKHSNASVKRIVLSLKQGAADLDIDIAQAWRHRAEYFMKSWTPELIEVWGRQQEYQFMLNSAFTDEILEYAALRSQRYYYSKDLARQVEINYAMTANVLYRALHHELIPMLIAMLPKLSHIIYKYKSVFGMIKHTALDALGVTEFPYLRTLEIDKDLFSILKRAPNLEQLDITKIPLLKRDEGPSGDRSKIKTLRLENASSISELSKPLSFAAKDLRSLVIESGIEPSLPWLSADVIEKVRDYRHSLETIHLDLRSVKVVCRSDRRDCTFRDFGKLQNVFLSTRLIFSISRQLKVEDRSAITRLLPPSIVSLHLVWDGTEIDSLEQGLLGLAAATTDRFQSLKFVGLDYAERVNVTVDEAMLKTGVEFTYESWPVSFNNERYNLWAV
ncbi:hypothetical protein H9Q69_010563 [Fusarium xylarioides]|nr:hypothetical protein H9Q69_010563 [Fusarium xylarioides]